MKQARAHWGFPFMMRGGAGCTYATLPDSVRIFWVSVNDDLQTGCWQEHREVLRTVAQCLVRGDVT